MKNSLFYLMLLLLASSCVSLPSPKSIVYTIDYSTLTNKGIFVTESNSVSFEYKPIASVILEETGGYVSSKSQYYDDMHGSYVTASSSKKRYQNPSMKSALEHLSEKLIDMGATGIINLEINAHVVYINKRPVDKVIITGMAIKK